MVIMEKIKKQILLSNDDGIDSPGLWAAAEALSELGYVLLQHRATTCPPQGAVTKEAPTVQSPKKC
jgi:broad specificity polyphosphatase/5'/3'-nucleotidase SurE